MQFGAVEIPIGVPNADKTLATLARIDERAQQVAEHVSQGFGGKAVPAFKGAGAAAEGLEGRLSHLGIAGSFAMSNLANGSEQGVTRLAHSLALFGGAFGAVGIIISTFVAVAGEQLLEWYRKSTEAADKATDALRKLRDEQRQGKFGDLHEDVNRTQEQIFDLDKQIASKKAEIAAANASLPSASRGGRGRRDTSGLDDELKALQRQRTDLVSLVASGEKGIEKIKDDQRVEDARKAKEANAERIRTETVAYDAEEKLAKERGKALDAVVQGTLKIGEEARKRTNERSLKAEEAFYKQLEIEERDYFENRRRNREKDLEQQRKADERARELVRTTTSIINDTVQGALSGNGTTAFADSIMKIIGDLFTRIGEAMLTAAPFLQAIAQSLLNPASWIGGGAGLVAGGIGLIALGSALSHSGSGSSSGGVRGGGFSTSGSGFSYGQAVVSTITPNYLPNTQGVQAKSPVTLNATIFGKHDPTFQRELLEAISVAQRRGSSAG